MDASKTCDQVLQFIEKSNLNYFLSESAFSVSIKIKKTFITNKDGSFHAPNLGYDESALKTENSILKHEIEAMKYKMNKPNDDQKNLFSNQAIPDKICNNFKTFPSGFPEQLQYSPSRSSAAMNQAKVSLAPFSTRSTLIQPKPESSFSPSFSTHPEPSSNYQLTTSSVPLKSLTASPEFKSNLAALSFPSSLSNSLKTCSESLYRQKELKTSPTQNQLNFTSTLDQLNTTLTQDQVQRPPILNQLNTTTTLDQVKTPPTQDELKNSSIQDQMNTTTTQQDHLAFPFKFKPRTFWNESDK